MQRKYALLIFILQMRAIKLAKFKWLSLEAHTLLPAIHKCRELEWMTTALGRSSEARFWYCFRYEHTSMFGSTRSISLSLVSLSLFLRSAWKFLRMVPPCRVWWAQHSLDTVLSFRTSSSPQGKIHWTLDFQVLGMTCGSFLWPDTSMKPRWRDLRWSQSAFDLLRWFLKWNTLILWEFRTIHFIMIIVTTLTSKRISIISKLT